MSRLYYKKEALYDWNFSLPVGNGILGAMIYGNKDYEKLQLNEDSLWYGGPQERINQDAKINLEKVRNLIFDGRIPEAEELILHSFSGNPPSQRPYSTLGEMYIQYKSAKGEWSDYSRELDLETAIHRVHKKNGSVTYNEEIFASAPDNVIVINISTEEGVPFDVDVDAGRLSFYDKSFHDSSITYFTGALVGDNYRFAAGITATSDSGTIEYVGQYVVCRNVRNLRIFFTAATTYRAEDPYAYVRDRLTDVSLKEYDFILERHITDYQRLFEKSRLVLEYDKELDLIPTDERLHAVSEENSDNGLIMTYFDYGRYLLISSSRQGSLPANLQGIWNQDMDPAWGCKFTININTQMNYWPAEMFGLGECHLPLFELMKKMQADGHKTAERMYGCRGFCCHHNTDLWGNTAPQDLWIPGTYWVMSVPWLCTHIMSHYEYTKDINFLKEMYPLIKDSVLFFHDFLIQKDGKAVICPSVSPENTYILPDGTKGSICYSSTMDNEILRDHFSMFLNAYDIVGDDDTEFYEKTKYLLDRIPEIRIGKHGQIMEWIEDYDEAEPGHRHISQLYGLHPSHQISVTKTAKLAEAAQKTIERRLSYGGGHTGWSRAWIMNMYARLWNGEEVYKNLIALFKNSTLDNLFDNHPPFQIDGNFGSIAAIGEMLLQTDGTEIYLLPALPEAMGNGSFMGLYAPDGGVYSLSFKNGKLNEFSVEALNETYHAVVNYLDKRFKLDMVKGEIAHFEIY